MRESLFRAKWIDNGEWVEGFYTQLPKPSLGATIVARGDLCAEDVADYIIVNTSKQHSNFSNAYPLEVVECEQYEVDPETVCQYTGLKDRNGRKIFEGDIVKGVAYSTDFIGYIVWIDAISGFGVRYFNKHREPTAWENSSILKAIQRWKHPNEFQAEIIGNIFDNPELIN